MPNQYINYDNNREVHKGYQSVSRGFGKIAYQAIAFFFRFLNEAIHSITGR